MARIKTQIPRRKKPAQPVELASEWELDGGARATDLKMPSDRMQPKEVTRKHGIDSPAQSPKRSSSTI